MSNRIIIIVLALFLGSVVGFGCSTSPKSPSNDPLSGQDPRQQVEKPKLDKIKLSKQLGIFKELEDVGFQQVSFNDCSIPHSFRKSSRCSTQYLAFINFRMRCRDSQGTVEQQVSNIELEPLQSSKIKWEVGKHSGWTKTDSRGYGRAIVRSWYPMDKKQFRLTVNGQIMGVSAEQVRQFVLPNYWCK